MRRANYLLYKRSADVGMGGGGEYLEMAILKQREMLQHSLIQPDFNKGQATPADSPWCSNSQRKLGRSVVYEYRGEKSLRWSNCLRVTQYIIRLWTTWTSSILYHRTDQPVALEPCAVHKWFNPAPTSGQHGLPRAGLRNAFLLLWISGCRQQGCTRSPILQRRWYWEVLNKCRDLLFL